MPASGRAVIIGPGLELTCRVLDASTGGFRIRLDRAFPLPPVVVLVDLTSGVGYEADVAWIKGQEAGLKVTAKSPLGGLVPSRFGAARAAWLRATVNSGDKSRFANLP